MSGDGWQLDHVSKEFHGRPAVADLCTHIPPGDHTAILGISGSGKSTLLRLLAGLEVPSAGVIRLDGQVLSHAGRVIVSPHRRGVGMVFQDLALWPNLSVMGNILLGLAGTVGSRRQRLERAEAALAACAISALRDRLPASLSGGEQQRAALARAVAVMPRFLFLDEPFGGLDLVTKSQLLAQIGDLAHQRFTIVLVTHDPREATALCRRAVVLEEGREQQVGEWSELLRDPRSQLLRTFQQQLAATPLPATIGQPNR